MRRYRCPTPPPGYVGSKIIGQMLGWHPHTVRTCSKLRRYMFPGGIQKGHNYWIKLQDVLIWRQRRLLAFKNHVFFSRTKQLTCTHTKCKILPCQP